MRRRAAAATPCLSRAQVCQEVSGLLRRELRVAAAELRRAAAAELAAGAAAGEGDYCLTQRRAQQEATSPAGG
jgi:hypothetical protein